MKYNNISLNVLIKNKPITEFPHNGQVFVEGRSGSEFQLEVTNHNGFEVEAVISVDGLSIMDGKEAGLASSGYLLSAYQTIKIPGWMLNASEVAAFEFAGKQNSYANQSTGTARNTGVIGVLVFKSKAPVYQPNTFMSFGRGMGLGIAPSGGWSTGAGGPFDIARGYSGNSGTDAIGYNSMKSSLSMNSLDSIQISASSATSKMSKSVEPVAQNLGTAFGEAKEFATTKVTFDRGDLHAQMVIYYDDKRGLKARGIDLNRYTVKKINEAPNPFPAMGGCTPPAGWKR